MKHFINKQELVDWHRPLLQNYLHRTLLLFYNSLIFDSNTLCRTVDETRQNISLEYSIFSMSIDAYFDGSINHEQSSFDGLVMFIGQQWIQEVPFS